MKNTVLIVLCLLLLVACKQGSKNDSEEKNRFEVNGKIDNAAGKTIYLQQLSADKIIPVDSTLIADDFSFALKHNNTKAGFYILKIDRDNLVYLVLKPGDKVTVKGSFGKLAANYTVTGSNDCEIARELNLHMLESAGKLEEFNKIYQSALQNQGINIDDVLKELDEEALKLFELDKLYLTGFIHKHETSPVIYLALFQQLSTTRILNPETDIDIYEFTLEKLKKNFPEMEQTKTLEKQLSEYKLKSQTNVKGITVGSEAPDINLPDPDGSLISLYSLRGKVVLLDFWASWCKPCRGESPYLVEAYNKYNSRGFEIFQVSLDSDKNQWVQAIKDDKLQWYHVSDLKYWDCAPAKVYGVNGIPANFLLNKNGVIVATNLRGKALDDKLAEIFKQ